MKKLKLIDEWKSEAKRLWTVQLCVFFAAIQGGIAVIGAFENVLNPWVLLALSIGMNVIIGVARLMKQPGADG